MPIKSKVEMASIKMMSQHKVDIDIVIMIISFLIKIFLDYMFGYLEFFYIKRSYGEIFYLSLHSYITYILYLFNTLI